MNRRVQWGGGYTPHCFYVSYWRRDAICTWSSEPREDLAVGKPLAGPSSLTFLQEITQFTKSLFLEVLNEMCTEITKEAIDKVHYTSQSNLSYHKTRRNEICNSPSYLMYVNWFILFQFLQS